MKTIIGLLLGFVLLIHRVQMHPPPPPIPPILPPKLPPGLFQVFVVRTGQVPDKNQEKLSTLPTRPALASVPVVDHEEPVVFFWYPMHPQVPIEAFY